MSNKPMPKNPFESELEPLSNAELAELEKSRSKAFEVEPPSDELLANLDKAKADWREKERAEGAARQSNRAMGALVLIFALGLVVGSVFFGSILAMSMRTVGLVIGLTA